jgi:hypothetical protein
MQKLKLELDHLQVQSFATGGDPTPAGTIKGNGATDYHCTALSGCCLTDWGTCLGCVQTKAASCGNYCTDFTFCAQAGCGTGEETCQEWATCEISCPCG